MAELKETMQDSTGKRWNMTRGLGTDLAQLLQINPKVGAGGNSIGFIRVMTISTPFIMRISDEMIFIVHAIACIFALQFEFGVAASLDLTQDRRFASLAW
jgi:hypothetical protein